MASSAPESSNYDPSTFWVAPARNFRTSARLHLQHLLFQNTINFVLEPHVQAAVEGAKELRVADLGCGNGIWLSDLDGYLSKKGVSAKLDGYDVNPINFPAPPFLPETVTLNKLNVFTKPLPEELIGAYDIVHVRALVSVILNSDLTPLLSTALALLKPGGWLQWEESRADTYFVEAPSPEVSTNSLNTIIQILHAGGKARGVEFEFLGELDRHLKEHGFEDVHMQGIETRKQDKKAWTEDYLMVWEELAVHFPPKATAPGAPMTRESWVDLFAKAVGETEKGVVAHQGKVVTVVGRKAN
ncbi:putative umta methyltransferase family protein [Eutypa lata UCREL1]|uniref:Putative umta methyltransferase family protein n=1 Tax=Eutypa lata (strain UCR-EL1) TaxID=1287681 RepID=M7T2X4_EUTLA|nr:putative umta methyltransferase family protein [Eutypa lata UCREL1]